MNQILHFDEVGYTSEIRQIAATKDAAGKILTEIKKLEIENIKIESGLQLSNLCQDPEEWLKEHIVSAVQPEKILNIGVPVSRSKLKELIELPDLLPLIQIIKESEGVRHSFVHLNVNNGKANYPVTDDQIKAKHTIVALDKVETEAAKAHQGILEAVQKLSAVVHTPDLKLSDLISYDKNGKPTRLNSYFWPKHKDDLIRHRNQANN